MPETPQPTSATTSVIIAAHTLDRWAEITACAASALGQQPAPLEVIIAVDHNPALFERIRNELPGVTAVLNEGSRGASGTRNAGARAASGEIFAFLDDDALAHDGWLAALIEPLARDEVVGVGGYVAPIWRGKEATWLPLEFYWVIGATYRGMPENGGPIRNVWAENMAVTAEDFWAVDGFREDFGKVGNVSKPEDTDFCIRVAEARPGKPARTWWYAPAAGVGHTVPPDRSTYGFYLKRCLNEGAGKAELAALVGESGLSDEKGHALSVIPRGFVLELGNSVRHRDLAALQRAGSLVTGLGAAGVGYLRQRARHRLAVRKAA